MPPLRPDLSMVLVDHQGRQVPAESQIGMSLAELNDQLQYDFRPTFISDLWDFNFAFGTQPPALTDPGPAGAAPAVAGGARARDALQKVAAVHLNDTTAAGVPVPVDMQPVSFTRRFDSASPTLLQAMVTGDTLQSLIVVKRKASGADSAGLIYLRVDFSDVLVIALDWQDSDRFIEEKCTFIWRKAQIRYRLAKGHRSLGETIEHSWTLKS